MARIDDEGNIVPSPGQTFGDPIPRQFTHISEIENDELIYADVTKYTDDDYMGERERIAEVIELNATTGVDLDYWFDRGEIISGMQRQRHANIRGMETF